MVVAGSQTNRIDAVVSQFRQYDQSVVDFVKGGVPVPQAGMDVPIVMASPDRAFASMQEILGVPDAKNVPLPFISIVRTRVQYDPMRFHGANVRFANLGTSRQGDTIYQSKFPLPYDISYQIEFWAKNRETLNVLELWVSCSFNNGFEAIIPVDLSAVWPSWGTKLVGFENEGIQDNSNLEPQEEHRVLRFTQSMTAKAWILGDLETVKSVFEIWSDLYVVSSGTDISSVTGGDVDADPVAFERAHRITTPTPSSGGSLGGGLGSG